MNKLVVPVILLLIPISCSAITCIDGDTFKVSGTYYRVAHIDTPEKLEYNYSKASNYTCKYIKSHKLNLKSSNKDIYGRTLVSIPELEKGLISSCLAEPFYGKTTKYLINLYKTKCQK